MYNYNHKICDLDIDSNLGSRPSLGAFTQGINYKIKLMNFPRLRLQLHIKGTI